MMVNLDAGFRLGDFMIVKLLGAGGDGTVYQANQLSLNRPVALKVLGPSLLHHGDIARFRRQAQAVAKLSHPHICEVYCVCQDETYCYMATRLVDGCTLRQFMNRVASAAEAVGSFDGALSSAVADNPGAEAIRFDVGAAGEDGLRADGEEVESLWPTAEAVRFIATKEYIRRCCNIVSDAASALDDAHRQTVVHRDVKPENIMLDRAGAVSLIDFGFARFLGDVSLSSTGALVGTPMYMSPEQITGRVNVDHRSDVYSLGIVLYELLTVRPPMAAKTREGVLRQIVTKAMPPVSSVNQGVPKALEAVVHKATAKDPDERYQDAAAFAADLNAWLEGRPVSARPYRFRLDGREIVAERPKRVVVTAFFYFVTGSIVAMMLLVYVGEGTASHWTSSWDYFKPAAAGAVTLTLFAVGRAVMTGRRWAAAVTAAASVTGAFFLTKHVHITYYYNTLDIFTTTVLASVVLFCLFAIYATASAKSRSWFRHAHAVRSEFRRLSRPR